MTLLGKIFAGIGLMLASVFGVHQATQPQQTYGNYNPAGGGTYRIQSSIGSTDSSITLSSFKEPVSNIPYTMSYLNSSIEYGTLEPGNSSKKEFISFSGITQNSDGTATLTGVVRGLSFAYPYTASTTLQQTHSGQSIFILSNPPQLTNQYANKNNTETITGIWSFTSGANPGYTAIPASFASTDFVPYQTLLNTAISGAATSSETNMGIVQLATQSQLDANTASSSQGRPLVIPNKLATSTCQFAQGATLISSSTTGKLGGNCVDGTYAYTFSGGETFTGTTSISASNVNTNPLKLNGLGYAFPVSRAASGTVPTEDGNGNISFNQPAWKLLVATTTAGTISIATTTITGTPQDLEVVFSSPGTMTSNNIRMFFNGDVGANYGYTVTASGGGFGSGLLSGNTFFNMLGNATTSPTYMTIYIKNSATNVKTLLWNADNYSAGNAAPALTTGAGQWSNTSNAISTIEFQNNGGTFSSGLNIQVYGSGN